MKTYRRNPKAESGFMLLEVLIAILIFSLGVVGMIGLQAISVKQSTDAKYRSEAALLVDQLIGNMWVGDRSVATLQTNFNTGGNGYNSWLASVSRKLPGVAAHPPAVSVDAAGVVNIEVLWVAPHEVQSGTTHSFVTVAQIR